MYDAKMMGEAIGMSRIALSEPGTKPFGAVIVRDGEIVGRGVNRAMQNLDPTAHGEVEAIRDACRNLGTMDLRGAELYTSCEPCSLCVSATFLSGIRRLYFGTTMRKGAEALASVREKLHVDPFELRREAGLPPEARTVVLSEQYMGEEAQQVLVDWARFLDAERAAGRPVEIE